MNLAEVIVAKADPEQEPQRGQVVILDGCERLMLACLDRTAVLEVDGERVLVPLTRIQIRRPRAVRWQRREEKQGAPAWLNRRRNQEAQSKAAAQKAGA